MFADFKIKSQIALLWKQNILIGGINMKHKHNIVCYNSYQTESQNNNNNKKKNNFIIEI